MNSFSFKYQLYYHIGSKISDNNRHDEHLGLKKRCIRYPDEEKFDQTHGPQEMKLILFDLLQVILEFQTFLGDVRRIYKEKLD